MSYFKRVAIILNVSDRTIREDIKRINSDLKKHGAIISSSSNGFSLEIIENEKYRSYYKMLSQNKYDNDPQITFEVLLILLLEDSWTTIEELASKFYVSRTSINTAIKEIKQLVLRYSLHLEKKPNYGLMLIGKNELKFEMLLDLVNENFISTSMISKVLKIDYFQEQFEVFTNVLIEETSQHFKMQRSLIENIARHLQLLLLTDMFTGLERKLKFSENTLEKDLANQITKKLISLGYEISQDAENYLAIQLTAVKQYQKEINQGDNPIITEDLNRIIDSIFESFLSKYNVDFRDDFDLRMSLALHMIALFTRIKYRIRMKNPILNQTKNDYPLAYNLSMEVGQIFRNEFDYILPEDELGFFAIYFGLALERKNRSKQLRNILIICGNGRATSSLLAYKIKSNFSAYLNLVDTTDIASLPLIDIEKYDYILTTVEINHKMSKQIIQISCMLDSYDIRMIENTLVNQEGIAKFSRKIGKDLFFNLKAENKNYQEVLKELCDLIPKRYQVTPEFYEQVLERDEMYSTAIGNLVAIPHSIDPLVESTFCAFGLLDQPIKWKDNLVQVIVLLGLSRNLDEDMQVFYQEFSAFVTNKKNILRLIQKPVFENLLAILEE